jgi:hypothetical protein
VQFFISTHTHTTTTTNHQPPTSPPCSLATSPHCAANTDPFASARVSITPPKSFVGLNQQSLLKVGASSTSGFPLSVGQVQNTKTSHPVSDEISAVTTLESLRYTITNGHANHSHQIKTVEEEVISSRHLHTREFKCLQEQINTIPQHVDDRIDSAVNSLRKTLNEEMAIAFNKAIGPFMVSMMKQFSDFIPADSGATLQSGSSVVGALIMSRMLIFAI